MTSYAERLVVPWHWWLRGLVVITTFGWVARVATNIEITIIVLMITALFVFGGLLAYGRISVAANSAGLQAGRAHIENEYIGQVQELTEQEFREWMGPKADYRGFLCTRPYIPAGVKVEITDPNDPTPYWLISSRNPEKLAQTLEAHNG